MLECGICAAEVSELRRGRCWGCYSAWMQQRPVGRGATCAICYERRRDQLRMMELHSRSVPLCHGCAARVVKVAPLPETIEGIRASLRRDRRALDRRDDHVDQRIFPRERRVGDRRDESPLTHSRDTDPNMMIAAFDDLVIEIGEGDIEEVEPTVVRQSPQRPRVDD